MSQPRGCRLRAPIESLRRTTPWGTQWGQLDGRGRRPLLHGGGAVTGRARSLPSEGRPCLVTTKFLPSSGGRVAVRGVVRLRPPARPGLQDSYLVDSASSHMLVSKIKPCMSKYKQSYCETANGSLNQLSFI